MERNFNNEFERFLKENADQLRLYPSSKVWNGIYSALHTRRKWFGLGIVMLLITGALVTFMVTHTSKQPITAITRPTTGNKDIQAPAASISQSKHDGIASTKNDYLNHIAIASDNLIVQSSIYNPAAIDLIPVRPYQRVDGSPQLQPLNVNVTDQLTDQDILWNPRSYQTMDYPKAIRSSSPSAWTIESVLNTFARKTKRLTFQLSITPMISYRKLSENKPFLASTNRTAVSYPYLYDVNSVVTHKPDVGLEFGLTSKYSLSRNFRVKAGLQFNINRYDIKAFNSSFEVAKIDLRGATGIDSVYALSTHRNFNGYKSDWLQNFYFEIALPVGAEVNIVGDDKVQFGVGGTIQPTYVLGDRAYLLSTDYKNYALVPWLIRRWNVSTGLEAFVSYSTGKIKWQVGPEMHYQLLSSFVNKYPVKENLFDFGLKVGVSLTK